MCKCLWFLQRTGEKTRTCNVLLRERIGFARLEKFSKLLLPKGQGLGALLLVDALRWSLVISEQVGIRAVKVDAFDDTSRNFYLKFGFRALLDDPRHLFLTMAEIRKLKLNS